MSADYVSALPPSALPRYRQKLQLCGLKECPYRLPADVWTNNPQEWPQVDFGNIYVYLIDTPGIHTIEAMKHYKDLASYKLLESGCVQTVYHMKPEDPSLMVLRADVGPSFRVNDPPHHPWAAISNTGDIVTAHCDCKAGLGESCSHIGGLLHKVELIVRTREPACTDVLSSMEGVQPARIADINFYGTRAKKKIRLRNTPVRRARSQPPTHAEQQQVLLSLLAASEPVRPIGLTLFSIGSLDVPKELNKRVCGE